MAGKLHLKLNAEQLRHSHVLHLKNLFRSFSGSTPLVLEFHTTKAKLGHLAIDARWGVALERELEQELRKLPFLMHLSVEEK